MVTAQQNDRMTRVGPGTPCGALLRHYWQPIALVEELPQERPIKPIKLMGQDFVLFREPTGQLGLLDRACPHRGADLAFGRLEDGGVRCAFHGWLFDRGGNCLQVPAEPHNQRLCSVVKQGSYPVVERSGIVFAYIGPGDPPPFQDLDCFEAPGTHTFAFKGLFECNWLQALEVGIDPAHASFLHRFFGDESTAESYGKQFRGATAGSDMPITKVLREFESPDIHTEKTSYGMRLTALRRPSDQQLHVRVTNVVFPQAFVIPMSAEMTISQWHVPVDDENCYWYAIFTSFTEPVDHETMRQQRLELYELPDYRSRRNKSNHYGFDAQEQSTQTYTGMGFDINVHDQWAVESQGPIYDRTREHLGTTDKGIAMYRRMLLQSIDKLEQSPQEYLSIRQTQGDPTHGPATVDGVTHAAHEPAQYRDEADLERRRESSWASKAIRK